MKKEQNAEKTKVRKLARTKEKVSQWTTNPLNEKVLDLSSSVIVCLMVLMALFWSTDWMCMVTIWLESMSRKSFKSWSLRSEAVIFRKLTAPKMPPI